MIEMVMEISLHDKLKIHSDAKNGDGDGDGDGSTNFKVVYFSFNICPLEQYIHYIVKDIKVAFLVPSD